jgi:hypothetical protein
MQEFISLRRANYLKLDINKVQLKQYHPVIENAQDAGFPTISVIL